MTEALTAEFVRSVLEYDPESGVLTWKADDDQLCRRCKRIGKTAGSIDKDGYLVVVIRNRWLRVHRVVWLIQTGAWPEREVTHVNLDPADNRWSNLALGVPACDPKTEVTFEFVRAALNYDPQTGELVWRWRADRALRWNTKHVGKAAGVLRQHGYLSVRIGGASHYVHRLVWLWMTGTLPAYEIDHANCDKADNRWANLREAERSENLGNSRRRADNVSGFKGVRWREHANKWDARITKRGKRFFLGYFFTAQEAHAAYVAKAKEIFGAFARAA